MICATSKMSKCGTDSDVRGLLELYDVIQTMDVIALNRIHYKSGGRMNYSFVDIL